MPVPWTIEEQLDVRRQLVHDWVHELAPAHAGHDEPEVLVLYGESMSSCASSAKRTYSVRCDSPSFCSMRCL